MASRTWLALRPCDASFSTSSSTCTSRRRPPDTVTSPTPLTASSARRIRLSAISVSARRPCGPPSAIAKIGCASGSTLAITGGSTCGGRRPIAPATFSRISCAASLMSRSRTNLMVMRALPTPRRDSIWSTPATPASACSSGSAIEELISSGLAPGRRTLTETVAGSAFGSRSTLRSRKENRPVTTSAMIRTVVNAGRRTQNSANFIGALPRGPLCAASRADRR